MSPTFAVKWIRKDEISAVAERFLREYHQSLSIPVPIEEIVEFDLDMDIIPIEGLKQGFTSAGFDIDAFLSSDLMSITVDRDLRDNRYRFTLAHELAHKLLHAEIYQQYGFGNIEEWLLVIAGIQASPYQKKEREKAEWQADELAGRILVPKTILAQEFDEEREETFRTYSEDHPEFTKYSDEVDYLDFIISVTVHSLAQKFVVSDRTMKIRLENDRLIERRR